MLGSAGGIGVTSAHREGERPGTVSGRHEDGAGRATLIDPVNYGWLRTLERGINGG